ncbi:MAG: hypothetical protein NVSMB23_25540 [Myxococcales bacterium]
MAILQALLNFIRGSAGKALNAIFGWAVLALFGQTSKTEQTVLSALVASAAAWPLLVFGVAFPKVVLFLVAAVPLIGKVPPLALRLVWVALALLVPVVVGIAVAARSPPDRLPEPTWKKLLRGFPITLGLAAAFLLMLVIAPCQRMRLGVKGWKMARIPLIAKQEVNDDIADAMLATLAAHGIFLGRAQPGWTLTAPTRVLQKLGGRAFSSMVGERIHFLRGATLEIAQPGNEMLLRGKDSELARAHALAAEVLAPRDVLQVFDPRAQSLEKQIKRVWSVYADNPRAHVRAPVLRARRDEIARELFETSLEYDEWQVVYRELLQLDRALRGEPALLASVTAASVAANSVTTNSVAIKFKEERMEPKKPGSEAGGIPPPAAVPLPPPRRDAGVPLRRSTPASVEELSNRELIAQTLGNATLLVKKEIELARAELRADLKSEVAMVKGLGIAGLCALCTLNLILVCLVLALGTVMPEWASALVVAAVVLALGSIAGVVGWGKRVKDPLSATRRTLKEDLQWAKERIA